MARKHGDGSTRDASSAGEARTVETLGVPGDAASGTTRREVLRRGSMLGFAALAAQTGLGSLASRAVAASASGPTVRIGFIALTDAASVIMAQELGYFKRYGVNVELIKQASWPATRDALINGDIDMAHALFSLPFSVATGIGGHGGAPLKVAMILNNNGQAITLKSSLRSAGYDNLAGAKKAINGGRGLTFAMTFPGGTHDTWLRYWLKAMGVGMNVPKIIPIPPPQMVANMQVGNMDGFCVGEPWNAVAVSTGVGFTTLATQDLWDNHPEKALVVNSQFASSQTPALKKVMAAVLDASKWLDNFANRTQAAVTIAGPNYINTPPGNIGGRLLGNYQLGDGLGAKSFGHNSMVFFRGGAVNFPRRAYGLWFLAQYQRFGYLTSAPDYNGLVNSIILSDLYKQVAKAKRIPIPNDDMAPIHIKLDGAVFDPRNPAKEAARA